MRDIQRAYQDAMVAEYEALTRSGRKAEAAHVKQQLAEQFGYSDSDAEADEPTRESTDDSKPPEGADESARESTDEPKPPEAAVEPKPGRRGPRQPAGRKAPSKDSPEG